MFQPLCCLYLPLRLSLTRPAILTADTDVMHVPTQVWPELSDIRRVVPGPGFYYLRVPPN
jgi:hypothetical protein